MPSLKEINRMRQSLGLPLIVQKLVECIICKRVFKSCDYPRQRLCYFCRKELTEGYSED